MIEKKVKELISDVLVKENVYIDTIKYEKEGKNNFLRIVVDSDVSLDIDKIVEITKIINPILDEADIIDEAYVLDISSKEKGE